MAQAWDQRWEFWNVRAVMPLEIPLLKKALLGFSATEMLCGSRITAKLSGG
jgi:hypothetical protein